MPGAEVGLSAASRSFQSPDSEGLPVLLPPTTRKPRGVILNGNSPPPQFSKNNRWAEPLAAPRHQKGRFPPPGSAGRPSPQPGEQEPAGSQPAGAGPRAPRATAALWGEEPFGNLRAPPLPWPRTTRAEAEVGGAHGCGLRGLWIKCGLHVPRRGSQQDHLTPT